MRIITTTILLTNKCNYNCVHCFVNAGKKLYHELTLEEIKDVLIQLKKLRVEKIELSGGEPLLRDDLIDIIKFAKKLNFKVKILTNGSLLCKEKIKKFKEIGLDAIAISLDGLGYEIYKKIRPVTKHIFLRVLKNIKLSSSLGIFTKINTVLMKSNINNIQKIIDFCEKNKIKELRICYFTMAGRGGNLNECVNPEKWIRFLKGLKFKNTRVYTGFSYANFKSSCMLKEEIPLCISAIGEVHACPLLKSLGNLRKLQLNEIIKKFNRKKIKTCLSRDYLKNFYPTCPLKKFDISQIK